MPEIEHSTSGLLRIYGGSMKSPEEWHNTISRREFIGLLGLGGGGVAHHRFGNWLMATMHSSYLMLLRIHPFQSDADQSSCEPLPSLWLLPYNISQESDRGVSLIDSKL